LRRLQRGVPERDLLLARVARLEALPPHLRVPGAVNG
jgi:hypothetical protein